MSTVILSFVNTFCLSKSRTLCRVIQTLSGGRHFSMIMCRGLYNGDLVRLSQSTCQIFLWDQLFLVAHSYRGKDKNSNNKAAKNEGIRCMSHSCQGMIRSKWTLHHLRTWPHPISIFKALFICLLSHPSCFIWKLTWSSYYDLLDHLLSSFCSRNGVELEGFGQFGCDFNIKITALMLKGTVYYSRIIQPLRSPDYQIRVTKIPNCLNNLSLHWPYDACDHILRIRRDVILSLQCILVVCTHPHIDIKRI